MHGMLAVDTNIIVRLLTKDDKKQFDQSYHLLQSSHIFIADTVILETEWVLRFAYEYSVSEICHALRQLFGLKNITLSNPQRISQILNWYEKGLDFADAFHLANSQKAASFKTFDAKFIKHAKGLSKCHVEKP